MAVTTAERRALCAVAERLELERSARPDPNAVDVVVSRVLLGFEIGRGREEVSDEILVNEYIEALSKVPMFAIHGAGERFRSGETLIEWNRAFRPSPAQFAEEARRGQFLHNLKLVQVRQILAAEVIEPRTPESEAKVAEAAANWRDMRAAADAERERARPAPEEVVQAREAHLHEVGAQFREQAVGGGVSHLLDRLGPPSTATLERMERMALGQRTASPSDGIPFMVTAAMRRDLAAAGYGEADIAQMTPARAWAALGHGGDPKAPRQGAEVGA